MSRTDRLGEILDSYEGREYAGGSPKKPDVKVWEEIQRCMEEKGVGNELHMLTPEAKNLVYWTYESAKELTSLQTEKLPTLTFSETVHEEYLRILGTRLINIKDMKEFMMWAELTMMGYAERITGLERRVAE